MFEQVIGSASRGSACVVVGSVGGGLAGFAVAEMVWPEAHLTNLAVDPCFRNGGLGRALVEEVIRWARERGLEEVWLEVRQSNATAISLYRSVGFVPVALRRAYYRAPTEDALVMVMPLVRDLSPRGVPLPPPELAGSDGAQTE